MLLAVDGFNHVIETFPVDQADGVVAVGEAFAFVGFVLVDSLGQVAGHADVERAAGGALQHVDVVAMFSAHAASNLSSRAEYQVRVANLMRSRGTLCLLCAAAMRASVMFVTSDKRAGKRKVPRLRSG